MIINPGIPKGFMEDRKAPAPQDIVPEEIDGTLICRGRIE